MLFQLILVVIIFVSPALSQIYTQPFTTVTRITMLGSTHGQGTNIAPGECWDNLNPQRKLVQLGGYPRKASNGDVSWSWSGAKTGTCYAIGPSGAGGAAVWGTITGVLASQADLNTALGLKAPLVAGVVPTTNLGSGTANATTFLRGDNTWGVPAGGGGGSSNLPGLTDVDDAAVPTNRFTLLGNGTVFQSRTIDTTDIMSGVFVSGRLASGTATAGHIAYSTGPGAAPAWGPPPAGGGGGAAWGTITGVISSQLDLQAALDLKAPLASPVFTGTPTIPSFSLANHSHVDAGGGGQLDASNIFSSGIVPTARLGTGTASITTFLRGDGSWETPSGTGGATSLPELSDVDDTATPANRNTLVGNGTAFLSRPLDTTDILSGTFVSSRIASGTATAGYVPISTSPGAAPTWGPVTGSGTVTSVGTGCGLLGGAITTSGTLRGALNPISSLTGPYTLVNGDCGRLLSFGAAAAVTLPTIDAVVITAGWYTNIQNRAASGNVVISAATNLIDGGGAITLTPGQGVLIAATGTNYWTQRGMGTGAGGGGGTYVGGPDGCVTVNTATDPDQLDFDIDCLLTESYAWTGTHNFTGGVMIVPNSTSLPPTCVPGSIAMDTDATSGARYAGCDSANTWLPLGGGGGGMADPGSAGIMVRTTANVSVARSIAVGAGLSITNATGVAGNPTISGPTAQAGSFFSNWQFGGIAPATNALAPSNEGKGTRITASRNQTVTTCHASMVTTAVVSSTVSIGIYNPDETRVCAGTYTVPGTGSQTASVSCSATLVGGQDYYLLIATSDGTNSFDSYSLSTAGVRALVTASPAGIKPAVTIAGATFDATETMTKIGATANLPVIVCY